MTLPINSINPTETNPGISSQEVSMTKSDKVNIKRKLPLKFVIPVIVAITIIAGGYFLIRDFLGKTKDISSPIETSEVLGGVTDEENEDVVTNEEDIKLKSKKDEKKALISSQNPGNPEDKTKPFNVLILGIDRRYGGQQHWRTDVIQLATISKDRHKVLITHIPRDVWAGSYKINAIYNLQGPEVIKDKIQEITGQRPDRIIRFDFDAFVWAIDAVGGVTINIEREFTDNGYPNDRNGKNDPIKVQFDAGEQTLDGETALIYVRSRKGNNGEGSDYARGKRQQIIMKSIIKDFFNPGNLFEPKTAKTLYDLATKKIYTDFTLPDTKVLFDVAKNYKQITVKHLGLDTSNFLTTPKDRSAYGGAWTLIPKGGTYSPIHNTINDLIN